MSDDTPRKKVARQVKKHLDGLTAAGVEHLPKNVPLSASAAEIDTTASLGAGVVIPPTSSLFDVATETPDSPDARRHELTLLAEQVSTCDRCPELFSTRTQTVFGVGPTDPDICFVGEAPGADEDRRGEPFVGDAGQLLNKIIAAMGLQREEVYICNTLKCRPPNNRTPSPMECGNCRGYFERQLELVRPKYIVCLGATAAQNVLGSKLGIGKLRGTFHQFKGIPVICTYHPAALFPGRSPEKKKDVWDDMKALLRKMGRPIPAPGK